MTVDIERTDTTPNGNAVYESTGEDGHIVAIPEGDEVFISSVIAGDNTRMKELVSAVVDELDEPRLCFTNVINPTLKDVLDGFEEEQEYAAQYDEYVTVLRGEWKS